MSLRLPRLFKFMAGSAFVLAIAAIAYPQEFYKGKTIVFIVGTALGGGFDTYSRIAARHIGKHIPGNPNTMVQNMPGAGNLIAANYVYNKAEPDGLTVGHFSGSMIFKHVLARISHNGIISRAASAEDTFTSMIRGDQHYCQGDRDAIGRRLQRFGFARANARFAGVAIPSLPIRQITRR